MISTRIWIGIWIRLSVGAWGGRGAGERRKKFASIPPRGRSPTESLKNYWGWCGGGRAGEDNDSGDDDGDDDDDHDDD